MGVERFQPDFITRVAPKVMPRAIADDPHGAYKRVCSKRCKVFDPEHARAWLAAPWTYQKVMDYANALTFVENSALGGWFDQCLRDEQAEVERRRIDPLCKAEDELAHAEKRLREVREIGAHADADLKRQESKVLALETARRQEYRSAAGWLAVTRKLEEARIELERQHLFASSEIQPDVDSAERWVTDARAELEAAKQEQAEKDAVTQAAE